jgi:hypothetical protein
MLWNGWVRIPYRSTFVRRKLRNAESALSSLGAFKSAIRIRARHEIRMQRSKASLSPPSAAYGFVVDDDANAFFTVAENFSQPQDNEPSSQRADFACGLAVGRGTFGGVNTIGGPTG